MQRKRRYPGLSGFLVTLLLVLTILFPLFIKKEGIEAGFPSNWFGNRATGVTPASFENILVAGIFTMNATNAQPDNITAYIASSVAAKNIACAIYNSAEKLVATTSARSISTTAAWVTFTINNTFSNSSCLRSGQTYNLTIWGVAGTGVGNLYYTNSGGSGIKSLAASDQWGWDDPIGFNTLVDSDGLACIYCNYTTVTLAPSFSSPAPANASTTAGKYTPTNVTIASPVGTCTVCFYNGSAIGGPWTKQQQNNTVASGTTVRDLNASYASLGGTKYYWKVTANDGTTNSTVIYYFTTAAGVAPVITINYTGNHSDKGGPYFLPALGESTVLAGDFLNGYYTNDSYQWENWAYINCTITGGSPLTVYLHWHDETLNTWVNTTTLTKRGVYYTFGNYYDVNKTGVTANHKYSFDVYCIDSVSRTYTAFWNKTGLNSVTVRRYVTLGCTPQSIVYKPFYFYNASYVSADLGKKDRFQHDQGPDGSLTDTGFLRYTLPTDAVQMRSCASFVGFWYDNATCISPFTLTNIYYHYWFNATVMTHDAQWNKDRNYITSSYLNHVNITNHYSSIVYNASFDYHLATRILSTASTAFTDNDIYELYVSIANDTRTPRVISNRSFTSFVIFNVPSNATLGGTDTDSDGLTDIQELYTYYTNPFLSDTDADGVTDYGESLSGSDPNNYTSTIEWVSDWNIIQTISTGSILNITSFKTIQVISNGVLQNITSFKKIQTISNGQVQNITGLKVVQTISTGTVLNVTRFRVIQTISGGAVQNYTTFKVIQTISSGQVLNISGYKLVQTISNGIMQNVTSFKLQQTISNGLIQNYTVFKLIQTISNGLILNSSGYRLVQTISNGALQNITSFKLIQTISNGIVQNITRLKVVQTISTGIVQNYTTYKVVQTISTGLVQNISLTNWHTIQTISNGVLQNTTTWKIRQTITTGTILNTTAFKTVQIISNGLVKNYTAFKTIQIISSGSIMNTSSFKLVQIISGGTVRNISTPGWTVVQTISSGVVTNAWRVMQTISAGVVKNTSLMLGTIIIVSLYPNNTIVPLNLVVLRVTVVQTNGSLMNLRWSWNNSGAWQVLNNLTGVGNGTYGIASPVFAFINHEYDWRILVNSSGSDNVSRNASFTTGLASGGSFIQQRSLGIIGLVGVLGVIGFIFAFRRRKGKNERGS